MSLFNWAALARRRAGFVWERFFFGKGKRRSQRLNFKRPHRSLRIDPLEDRSLLSIAPVDLNAILVNQTFGAQQVTNTAHSIAMDNNGDFVVAWTRYDNVVNASGQPVIDPSTGNQLTVANVYARYFTDEVQQVSLPGADSVNANGTVLPNGIASNFDNDPNSVGHFSLTYNSQTVMEIAVTAGTAPAGDESATTSANIAGQFTLWFDANGDGKVTANEVTTINFDETNPTLSAKAIQTWLNTFGPTYNSSGVLVSDGSHAVVSAIDPQHYLVDFGTATEGLDQSSLLQYLSPTDPRVPSSVPTPVFTLSGFLPAVSITTQSRPFTVNNIPVSQTNPNLTALAIENYFQGQVDSYTSGAAPFTFPIAADVLPTTASPYTAPISVPSTSPGVPAADAPQTGFDPTITAAPVVNPDGSLSYTNFDITFTGVAGAEIQPQLIVSNPTDEDGVSIGTAIPYEAATNVNLVDATTNTTVTVPWLSGWTDTQVDILRQSSPKFQVNPQQTISSIYQPNTSVLASDQPAVTMDASGDFVIAWREQVSQSLAPKDVTDIDVRYFTPTGITDSYNPGTFVPGQTLDGSGQVTDDSGNVIPEVRMLPNPTVADEQQITFNATNGGASPISGSIQLQMGSTITESIAFNSSDLTVTAANIEAALTLIGRPATVTPVLPSIQPGKAGVYVFDVTFNGASTGIDEPPIAYVPVVDSSGNTLPLSMVQSSLTTDMYTIVADVNYTNPQFQPAVAMDPQGNFNVVWSSEGQDLSYFNDIYMQRFDRDGNRLGGVIEVNTETTSDELNPDVAMGPDDNSVVTWTRTDDPNYLVDGSGVGAVYARGFDSSGNALWPQDWQVGGGGFSTVAMDSQDNFTITWDDLADNDQNGQTSEGVFGVEYQLESAGNLAATVTNSTAVPASKQTLTFTPTKGSGPITGTFLLSENGSETQPINFDSTSEVSLVATASSIQTALNNLGFPVYSVTSGSVVAPYAFTIYFGSYNGFTATATPVIQPVLEYIPAGLLPFPNVIRPTPQATNVNSTTNALPVPFRVNSAAPTTATQTVWPYDQYEAEVAMDQDGDTAVSYQGYGPQTSQEIQIAATFFRPFFKSNTDTSATGSMNQDLLPYFNPFPHNGSSGDTLGFLGANADSVLYFGDNENVETAIDQVLFDAEYPATVPGDTNTPATSEQLGRLRNILESVAGELNGDSYAAMTTIINASPNFIQGPNSSDDIVNTQRSGSDQRYYIVFDPTDEVGTFQIQITVDPSIVNNNDIDVDVEPFTVTTGVIQVPNAGQFSPIDPLTTETNIATAIDNALGKDWPGAVPNDLSVNVRILTSPAVGTTEYDDRTGTLWDFPLGMPSDAAVDAAFAAQTPSLAYLVPPDHAYVIYELTFQGSAHDVPIQLGVVNSTMQFWTPQPGQQGAVVPVLVGADPPQAIEGDFEGVQSAPSYNASVAMTSEGDMDYAYTQQALQTDGTTPLNADGDPVETNIYAQQIAESTNTAGPQIVDWSDGTTDNKHFLDGGIISGVNNVSYFVLTFDQPMLAGDPAVDPDSVLNPANYELIDSNGNVVSNAIAHVDYGLSETAVMASTYGLNPVPSNKYEVILTLDGNPNEPGNQALVDGTYTLQVNQAVPSSSTSVGQSGLRNLYGTPLFLSGFNPTGSTFLRTITLGSASNPGPPGLAATDAPVNSQRGGQQIDPSVASASSGAYVVVWTSDIGGQTNIVGQMFGSNGLETGPEFTVNTTISDSWGHANVAMDPAGAFVVTWSGGGPGSNALNNPSDVFARRFNASGQAIGGQFQVNQYLPSVQDMSRVAMGSDGSFVITWESYGQGSVANATTVNYAIYARAYSSNGTPVTGVAYQPQGNEFEVSTPSQFANTSPDVAMDAADDFVIVWQGDFQSTSTWGIYGNYYYAATGKSTGQVLLNVSPDVRGSFTASSTFDLLNTGPRVGMASSNGDFVVTWDNYNPSTTTGYNIYARQFAPGCVPLAGTPSVSSEFQVNESPLTLQPNMKPPTIGWQLMPAVGVDAAGNFTIAWTSYGQDNAEVNNPSVLDYGIYARMYFANGTNFFDTNLGTYPLEYRVNATTLGNQVAPAVNRGDSAGDSVIAWVGPDPSLANDTAIFDRVVDPPAVVADIANAPITTNPSLAVSDASVSVGASGGQMTFTVTLSSVSTKTVSVNYTTADGTAKAGTNYTSASGVLTFAPGQTAKTITVSLAGMTLGGLPNTAFSLNLSSPVNSTLSRGAATGTIIDGVSSVTPSISVANVSVSVGTTASQAIFTVTLSAAYGKTVTVNYATANGTALSGTNFTAASGTLTFLSGQTSQTVAVPLAALTANGAASKTFQFNLTSAVNATIARASATGTIVDVVPAAVAHPSITVADVTVQVGTSATQAAFTVTLSAPSTNTINIIYGTADGTAKAASGAYTPTWGSLTFTPGQTSKTVSVPVAALRTAGLSSQNFIFNIAYPSNNPALANGTIVRSPATATLVDAVPASASEPTISVGSISLNVGSSATQALFTVSLSSASTNTVSLIYGTDDGTAKVANGAYTPTWGSLSFAPGQTSKTITVPVAGMTTPNLGSETFIFNLANAVNGIIVNSPATATLVDTAASSVVVPNISVADITVQAGSAATKAVFTVSLSAPTTNTVTMIYGTADGTATAASGAYTPTWGNLTFAPGTTTQTISVPVAGLSSAGLASKTFIFNLATPANGKIVRSPATATIVDAVKTVTQTAPPVTQPTLPLLTAGSVSINRPASGSATAVFTVGLSAASAQTVTVKYLTANATAFSGTDYTAESGTLTFAPGVTSMTIAVPVLANSSRSTGTYTFDILFSSASNAVLSTTTAIGTINKVVTSVGTTPSTSVGTTPGMSVQASSVTGPTQTRL